MDQLNLETLMEQRQKLQGELAENGAQIATVLGIGAGTPVAAEPKVGARRTRKTQKKAAVVSPAPSRFTRKAKVPKAGIGLVMATKAAKRSSEDLAVVQDQIKEALDGGALLSSEQLQAATGLSKAELTLPLKQLVKAGKVATVGEKRGTKYSMA